MVAPGQEEPCDDARATCAGTYSGWLMKVKSDNAVMRWMSMSTVRYFTIDFSEEVFYYSRSKATKNMSNLTSFKDILGAEELKPEPGFVVETVSRTFELYAADSADAARWVKALNAARGLGNRDKSGSTFLSNATVQRMTRSGWSPGPSFRELAVSAATLQQSPFQFEIPAQGSSGSRPEDGTSVGGDCDADKENQVPRLAGNEAAPPADGTGKGGAQEEDAEKAAPRELEAAPCEKPPLEFDARRASPSVPGKPRVPPGCWALLPFVCLNTLLVPWGLDKPLCKTGCETPRLQVRKGGD